MLGTAKRKVADKSNGKREPGRSVCVRVRRPSRLRPYPLKISSATPADLDGRSAPPRLRAAGYFVPPVTGFLCLLLALALASVFANPVLAQVPVSIEREYASIGAGLEPLVLTLKRTGQTGTALDATVTFTQTLSWLDDDDLIQNVTFSSGDDTTVLRIAPSTFSLEPDATGSLTATVSGSGILGSSVTVEVVSVAVPPVTVRLESGSYETEEQPGRTPLITMVATIHTDYPRAPPPRNELTYQFRFARGTANPHQDYILIASATHVFKSRDFSTSNGNLEASSIVHVELVNDDVYEGDETFLYRVTPVHPELYRQQRADGTFCDECTRWDYEITITDEQDLPLLSLTAEPSTISEWDVPGTPDAENAATVTAAIDNSKTFVGDEVLTFAFAGTAPASGYTVSPADYDTNEPDHQVTLPAGHSSVAVTLTAVDIATEDGPRTVVVTGSRDGMENGSATVTVTYDDRSNTGPAFAAATADREVAEDAAPGDPVGAPVAATDADGDPLTYFLEGADAASFDIEATTGQIEAKGGYDFEAEKNSYEVIVKAWDGYGGSATIAVTVSVTDVDQRPLAPAAPTVSPNPNSDSVLTVTWQAPDNAGLPEIAHYDVRYRESGAGGWTEGPQDVTNRGARLSGLTRDQEYEAQVRATNTDGDGEWSASGRGAPEGVGGSPGELRLTDGSVTDMPEGYKGRLEVFYRGEWGTVCSDRFKESYDNATLDLEPDIVPRNYAPALACRRLGYADGQYASGFGRDDMFDEPADSGQANWQRIWLDDVRCDVGSTHWTGAAPRRLHQCYNAGIGLENCDHREDAGVLCSGGKSPLDGVFQEMPQSHDRADFTFRVSFTEGIATSADDLMTSGFLVTEGEVKAASEVGGNDKLWEITVKPLSRDDVTIVLPSYRPCDETGAVCTSDKKKLSTMLLARVPGPQIQQEADPLEASFEGAPPAHDGETAFTLRLALSEDVSNSVADVQANTFAVAGATLVGVSQVDSRADLWELEIEPEGTGAVSIELAFGACGDPGRALHERRTRARHAARPQHRRTRDRPGPGGAHRELRRGARRARRRDAVRRAAGHERERLAGSKREDRARRDADERRGGNPHQPNRERPARPHRHRPARGLRAGDAYAAADARLRRSAGALYRSGRPARERGTDGNQGPGGHLGG